jgi:gamma-glutamyltranspeptidase/glutathione hydrolase
MKGLVLAAQPLAAQAGAAILCEGGNAIDAAIATALALCVVDPANCGFAGYGGYMTVKKAGEGTAHVVDFNTVVDAGFDASRLSGATRRGPFANGELSSSWPMVPRGIEAAHRQWGTRPLRELAQGALTLARDGFEVDANLAKASRWSARRRDHFNAAFQELFCPQGEPLREGERLRQRDLAATLETFVREPAAFYDSAPFASVLRHMKAREVPGWDERPALDAAVREATRWRGAGLELFGPTPDESGYGVLLPALQLYVDRVQPGAWDAHAFVEGLKGAWAARMDDSVAPEPVTKHTTHFCVLDGAGTMVSCTFTLGPLWFGSGVVVPGTGLVMNCGLNIARYSRARQRWIASNNLAPVIAEAASGARYCMGSPGGSRIPAVVLKLLLESVLQGVDLRVAIDRPRLSVSPRGDVEAEQGGWTAGDFVPLQADDFYGPASAIGVLPGGEIVAAVDGRCASGESWA